MIQCANCGNMNEAGAVFCDQCGTSLTGLSGNVTPAGASPTLVPGAAPSPIAAPQAANVCPSCGHEVIPGEAFCDNCGAALSSAPASAGAASAAPSPMATLPPQTIIPQPVPQQPAFTPPPVIVTPPPVPVPPQPAYTSPGAATSGRLEGSDGQNYPLNGKSVYLIGREDSVSGIFPDVDTTPTGGDQAGVSRRHAEVHQQGTQWFLTDLGSTNGTFINNQRLAPNQRTPLAPGSQIRLGKWAATFKA